MKLKDLEVTENQRALTAFGCVSLTHVTYFIIKKIRTSHAKRINRKRYF